MDVCKGESNWIVNVSIHLWLFNNYEYFSTLCFKNTVGDYRKMEGSKGIIWLIYQDRHTLQLASEYHLKNTLDKNHIYMFYTTRRMFSSEAQISAGRLNFKFNTNCGVKQDELKRAVTFIEDGFIKIGLRS